MKKSLSVLISLCGSFLLAGCGGGSGNTPPQGPTIVTTSLPDGTIGTSYSQTIQATGGVAPFTWSVTSGALPHGVTLPASTGNSVTFSGTPDRVQASVAFTIQVADANSQSGQQPYTVNIKSTPTIAVTQSGAVQGVVDGNFLRFRGIPFATPPLGNLRWKPPVAPASWDGIRSAASFGNKCPQTDFAGGVQGNEDCLTLNVYSTYPQASSKQPVMVFFHGGGNVLGSAQDPPWELVPPLAGHGVLVVTAQYRLGIFGDLADPLLTAESGTGSSGNYFLMDMILALQWVHDNIAQFNGDPTHVMMFGQSAGSINVEALLASPKAAGLFTSAGMESGVIPAGLLGSSVADAYAFYAGYAAAVGCSPPQDVLACLRVLPVNTIMQRQFVQFPSFMGYNLEPVVLPEDPFLKLKQAGSPVPLLIGSNRDEVADQEDPSLPLDAAGYAAAIHAQFDPLKAGSGNTILSLYPATFDTTPRYTHIDVGTDYMGTWPTRDLSRGVAAVGDPQKQPVWRYLFAHQYETDAHLNMRRAFHTAELYFVAGLVPGFTRPVYYDGTPYTPNAAEGTLSSEMMDYWSRFAATGDPNGGGAVQWLPYDASENILQFGVQGGDTIANLSGGYRNTQCDFLSTLSWK